MSYIKIGEQYVTCGLGTYKPGQKVALEDAPEALVSCADNKRFANGKLLCELVVETEVDESDVDPGESEKEEQENMLLIVAGGKKRRDACEQYTELMSVEMEKAQEVFTRLVDNGKISKIKGSHKYDVVEG